MTSAVIVVGEASQPALRAGLTGIPGFGEPSNPRGNRLKEFLNDVSVTVFEIPAEISPSKGGEVAHAVEEKLCIIDVVALFELQRNRVAGFVPRRGDRWV